MRSFPRRNRYSGSKCIESCGRAEHQFVARHHLVRAGVESVPDHATGRLAAIRDPQVAARWPHSVMRAHANVNALGSCLTGATIGATMNRHHSRARRDFLKFLAASPYVIAAGGRSVSAPPRDGGPEPNRRGGGRRRGKRSQRIRLRGGRSPESGTWSLGLHGQRRGRRCDAAGESRHLPACAAPASPAPRCDAGRHARRVVWNGLRTARSSSVLRVVSDPSIPTVNWPWHAPLRRAGRCNVSRR